MQRTEIARASSHACLRLTICGVITLVSLGAAAQQGPAGVPPAVAAQVAGALPVDQAGVAAMQDNVVTINQLLATENVAALAKARKEAEVAGLIKPEPVAMGVVGGRIGPPAPTLEVISIGGLDGHLHARLVLGGERYERVRPGERVGPCIVASIVERRVVLKPQKGVSPATCPSGTWTGRSAEFATGAAMPSPAIAAGAAGRPTAFSPGAYGQAPANATANPSFPLARSNNAAMQASGPMLELVPAGQVAPGQTSIPLVPRQVPPVGSGAAGNPPVVVAPAVTSPPAAAGQTN